MSRFVLVGFANTQSGFTLPYRCYCIHMPTLTSLVAVVSPQEYLRLSKCLQRTQCQQLLGQAYLHLRQYERAKDCFLRAVSLLGTTQLQPSQLPDWLHRTCNLCGWF